MVFPGLSLAINQNVGGFSAIPPWSMQWCLPVGELKFPVSATNHTPRPNWQLHWRVHGGNVHLLRMTFFHPERRIPYKDLRAKHSKKKGWGPTLEAGSQIRVFLFPSLLFSFWTLLPLALGMFAICCDEVMLSSHKQDTASKHASTTARSGHNTPFERIPCREVKAFQLSTSVCLCKCMSTLPCEIN